MQGRCPVRDRIFVALGNKPIASKSREGRNSHGKHIMTKGAFGRIFDKYAVPTGLGNVFLDCFAIDILSLTGQSLDHSLGPG